tara:strand:- start:1264 stop:1542 length:279 start_codon:yes stop_codon:yes gene_type:complete
MTSIEDKIEHPISEDDDEDDEIDDWMKSVENKIAILEKSTEKLKESTENNEKRIAIIEKRIIEKSTEKLKERIEAFERLFKIDKNEVNCESE